jgi:23S rRNA pseudouridine2605 synthase
VIRLTEDERSRAPRRDDGYGDARPARRIAPIEQEPEKRPRKKSFKSVSQINEERSFQRKVAALREPMRLNKFIAMSGVAGRREADQIIASGRVAVNGKPVTELGTKVDAGADLITLDGRELRPEPLMYVLLNKPKNTVTTVDDPEGRRTVIDLVQGALEGRIYPVGRLDRNTTGVLLLTNDGALAEKLTHPSHGVRKLYAVTLDRPITHADVERLQAGITLDDGPFTPDGITVIEGAGGLELGVEIHSGRNRIVRRMFEALSYSVVALDRVAFGSLTKKGVRRGTWRALTPKEVGYLQML